MNALNVAFVRYLHHTDHNSRRTRKIDEILADKLDFEDIKVPVKIKDTCKIGKKNSIGIVYLIVKARRNIQFIYQINVKHVHLLLIRQTC